MPPPPKHKRATQSITVMAIKSTFNTPDNLNNTILTISDCCDVYGHTVSRDLQVGGNAYANNGNTDAYNYQSFFNELVYIDPVHSEVGLTPGGWAFVGLSILPVGYGIVRRVYQIRRKIEINTYAYLQRRLKQVSNELGNEAEFVKTEIAIRNDLNNILNSGQIAPPFNDRPIMLIDEDNSDPDFPINCVTCYDKLFEPSPFVKTINYITSTTPAKISSEIWDYLCNQSFIFWVIGFPVGLALGAAAITYAPAIIGATIAVGATYLLYKGIDYLVKTYIKRTPDPSQPPPLTAEEELHITKLKQRYFMEQEHELLMEMLQDNYAVSNIENIETEKVQGAEGEYEIDKKSKIIRILRKRPIQPISSCSSLNGKKKPTPQDIFSTSIAEHLLGSNVERDARLIITTLGTAISAFIITTFVLYFLSCCAALIPGIAAGAFSTFLLGTEITAYASTAIGGLFGVTTFCKLRADQLAYEKKVYQILSAEYKPGSGITKADKFAELHRIVEAKKAEIVQLRNSIQALGENNEKSLLAKYDLNKVDVFNDYYFEKQKHTPSLMTWIKKGFNRLHAFVSGGESGIYLARTLLLAGGIAATAVAASFTGTLIPFLIIAGALGIVVGGLKLAQYQLDRNQEHREAFLNTIDNRIYYLELKNNELNAVLKKLKENEQAIKSRPSIKLQARTDNICRKKFKSEMMVELEDKADIKDPIDKDEESKIIAYPPPSSINLWNKFLPCLPVKSTAANDKCNGYKQVVSK